MSDRTVHAAYGAVEVVRYDKAGKWYMENGSHRERVTIDTAVKWAKWGQRFAPGARIFLGRPGGAAFDRKVRVKG